MDRGKTIDLSISYLATPYTKYPHGIERAFVDASKIAATLLRGGINVYSPISHCHPLAVHGAIDPLDHDIWLPFNEAMLRASHDLIVAHMDGWRESRGVTHEIETFERTKRPIFDLDPATMTLKRRKG